MSGGNTPPPVPPAYVPPPPDHRPPFLPPAARLRRRRYNPIWLIPIATLAIGVYLAWSTLHDRGPVIEVTFQTAEGLKAGQSQIRYKDVVLGTVSRIRLSDDFTHVVLTAEMRRDSEKMLTSSAKIWVVKPRYFAGSVQGLDTLLSGAYISLLPGDAADKLTSHFDGLEDPPVLPQDAKGHVFKVVTKRLGSVSIGSPVYYRDLVVGQVLGWDAVAPTDPKSDADEVTLNVFVRAPYDQHVQTRTHFWNASGFSVGFANGQLSVQLESLRAVLQGGIAFDNSPNPTGQDIEPATADTRFLLYRSEEDANNATIYDPAHEIKFVSYFHSSVAGLSIGSDVDLLGIKVGQVTGFGLRYDQDFKDFSVPVQFSVQPDRVVAVQRASGGNAREVTPDVMAETLRGFVARGMRARLASGNLLTGSQIVTLDFATDAPKAELGREPDGTFIMPNLDGGGIAALTASVGTLLAKVNTVVDQVNAIPFKDIGQNLDAALAGVASATSGPQLHAALVSLQAAMASAQELMRNANRELTPTLTKLPALIQGVQDAALTANKLLVGLATGYGDDSRFKRDLDRVLAQASETLDSVRGLMDNLTRHPELLLRGRVSGGQ